MSESAQQQHQARLQRMHDAVALKEPDRVPILSFGTNTFFATDAGYTVADTIYDWEKNKDAVRQFLTRYEPDAGFVLGSAMEGQGAILEKVRPKTPLWAGMKEREMDPNGVHQFIEFPLIEDDELHGLADNLDACFLTKILPRAFGILEPMAKLNLRDTIQITAATTPLNALVGFLCQPDVQNMIAELQEAGAMMGEFGQKLVEFIGEVEAMGFPVMTGAPSIEAYDYYSDFLRGTMLTSTDIYDYPEYMEAFMDAYSDAVIERLKANPPIPGRIMFMPMHKGMDGFISDEGYGRWYWPYLMKFVNAWIEAGAIPYVYTEGHYDSRMEYLKQLPKGKCIVHFEYAEDLEKVKREIGEVACITGIYPAQLIERGTVQQVVDEAKRLMDIFAPGGGYMFDFDGGVYPGKRENMEALFDTIKTYGKY